MHEAYRRRHVAELVEAGHRAVAFHLCKCGAECLRGEDHDYTAMIAVVDVDPVDRLDEVLALIEGRFTYDIGRQTGKTAKPGAFVLYMREREHIAKPDRPYPVLVEHRCRRRAA